MASYKDNFEPKTFAANTFAAGVWRGSATDAPARVVSIPPRSVVIGGSRAVIVGRSNSTTVK